MSDSRAFVHKINPIGSGVNENNSIHQVSPAWVLTFVRWQNRDTFRVSLKNPPNGFNTQNIDPKAVRDPLVVENDCVQCSVTVSKSALTPSLSATLVMTDVNYETSVAPGDFVIANMLNWDSEARRVATNARGKKPINGPKDGFKGVFKVQSVRKTLAVDGQTGTKYLVFKITGYAFTEFNNTIYFNPYMLDPNQDPKNQLLFSSYIGKDWQNLVNQKGLTNTRDIIAVLILSFIGSGISDEGRILKGTNKVVSPNVHFFIPELVGSLLGVKGAKAAKDLYVYLFGIQSYASGSVRTLAAGMNPERLTTPTERFFYTPIPCGGDSFLKPEYWNQVKTWSILNQYTNAPLNEIYTCFRISPNGKVMPTLVFRQIPFTTEDFKNTGLPVTKFMSLPRWKIDPALILDFDVGREEAARINFVQYFGKSTINSQGTEISIEIAQGNYAYDIDDVQRSGLRPYIVTTQFDEPTSSNKEYKSPGWAKIVADSLIGGHLKMNGTITSAGIVDPIAVGDNLELDGVIYHIEQVVHNCTTQDGKRLFRTSVSLSSGLAKSSSEKGTRYAEMNYTKAQNLRENDWANNKMLPGASESQDVVYRTKNPDVDDNDKDKSAQNAPFPQPNTKKGGVSDDGGDKT